MEFFERAQTELDLRQARIAAFGSTCKADTDPADDAQVQLLIDAATPAVTIFGKTWDLHVTEVLRTTLTENLRMIRETVRYLKGQGKEVIYDAEHFFDGYRANPEYALSTLKAAILGGADAIVLCDTNGGSLPWQVGEAVDAVRTEVLGQETPLAPRPAPLAHITLGIHAHNDSETGVANTLEAVRHGCTRCKAPSTATASAAATPTWSASSPTCSSRWATTACPRREPAPVGRPQPLCQRTGQP
jgi:2-isopropylmalate synthase